MDKSNERVTELSVIKRAKSFVHAGHGLKIFLKTTPNAWIQILIYVIAISFGFYFDITLTEWALLVLAGGLVLVSEAFNTAVEIDMNLTSPKFHPYARDTKDVAAAAVLLSALSALVIGILIFWPYLV